MGIKDLEKHCAVYANDCSHCNHSKECSRLVGKISSFSPDRLARVIKRNEDIVEIIK